jgi:hypothetical protein
MARCRRHHPKAFVNSLAHPSTGGGRGPVGVAKHPGSVSPLRHLLEQSAFDPSRFVARGVRLDFWIRRETIQIRRFLSAFGSGQIAVTGVVAQEWPAPLRPRQTLRKQAKGVRNETEFGPCSNRLSLSSKLR